MITKSSTAAGFQCLSCGRIQMQELSAFSYGKGRKQMVCRHCGRPFGEMESDAKDGYRLTLSCMDCFMPHTFSVGKRQFWQSRLQTFLCPNSEEMILAVGEKACVAMALEENFYLEEEDFTE